MKTHRNAVFTACFLLSAAAIAYAQAEYPKPILRAWTVEDTKALAFNLGGIAVAVLLLIGFVFMILLGRARNYVLANKSKVATRFDEAEKLASNPGVKAERRGELNNLQAEVSIIKQLSSASKGVNWFTMRRQLDLLNRLLSRFISDLRREIAVAGMARVSAQKLMAGLPGKIKAAELQLAAGPHSDLRAQCLEEARKQYAKAQQAEPPVIDWVVLYSILRGAVRNVEKAEWVCEFANTPQGTSSGTDDSLSSNAKGSSESDRPDGSSESETTDSGSPVS